MKTNARQVVWGAINWEKDEGELLYNNTNSVEATRAFTRFATFCYFYPIRGAGGGWNIERALVGKGEEKKSGRVNETIDPTELNRSRKKSGSERQTGNTTTTNQTKRQNP